MISRLTLPAVVLALAACTSRPPATAPVPVGARHSLIPLPSSVQINPAQTFVVDTLTTVYIDERADASVEGVANHLLTILAHAVKPEVRRLASGAVLPAKAIQLRIDSANAATGTEGYELTVTPASVTIVARTPAGLFHGVQTLRQLLPVSVEHPGAMGRKLWVPAGHVVDAPRFEWRGMMLDVSRHFLGVKDVKRFIDLMALYKLNRLHMHLADDQGWRIEILSRPRLATIGGGTQVGGGPGGYYTQAEYKDLVAYAASRFVMIVPEIDMPAHTNAALASYPELNCNNVSPPLYTGTEVGFSALCVDSARIYPVIEDIVREIAGLTPGPYYHIGGDEVKKLTHVQYKTFIERIQGIVNANGKRMIGWSEIAPAQLSPTTIVHTWIPDSSAIHVARGGKVIMSPAKHTYLDMKYDSSTVLGLTWAAIIPVRGAYEWDPANYTPGVPETAVLGVEAPLWSETVTTAEDYEYMAFPRLIAIAEVGWSSAALRAWDGFRARLELQTARLNALGVNTPR
ncbi:MAG: family 20 glycosylhydrolase [Gemmatimonadales bacterium]